MSSHINMASGSQEWKASQIRTAPYQKAKDGKWYFQIDCIKKCWALAGRKITDSNSKRYNSIGYETFEECEQGK
jgi:hypothetical protein